MRYGKKKEWVSREFYLKKDKAKMLDRYDYLIDDWQVEIIEHKIGNKVLEKNFKGKFKNK